MPRKSSSTQKTSPRLITGRTLDAFIAEKLMDLQEGEIPYYTTDIVAASQALERLIEQGNKLAILADDRKSAPRFQVSWGKNKVTAATFPEAVCLAAYKILKSKR